MTWWKETVCCTVFCIRNIYRKEIKNCIFYAKLKMSLVIRCKFWKVVLLKYETLPVNFLDTLNHMYLLCLLAYRIWQRTFCLFCPPHGLFTCLNVMDYKQKPKRFQSHVTLNKFKSSSLNGAEGPLQFLSWVLATYLLLLSALLLLRKIVNFKAAFHR